jgi:DNA-binding MarR family transcriptional regulator
VGASGPYGLLVSCVIASSPAPAAKRVRLVASNSPDDDAFFTFPPDSRHYLQVTPGGLFPALQRLEEDGWIAGEWGLSENNRKARFYTITKAGRRQLAREEDHWKAISVAVSRVLEGA